jgi:formate dehydrogenase
MKFFKHESCGQCTPCRNGTEKMTNLLVHREKDFSTINDLIEVMSQGSICGLGQAAGNCVKHLLKYFPEEMNNAKIK